MMVVMKLIMSIDVLNALRALPQRDSDALMEKIMRFAASPYDRFPWAKAFDSQSGRIRTWRLASDL